jgi:GntR family transcriptional regulator
MPLKLTDQTVRKGVGIPAYVQLANHVRQAILTGDIQPGESLPSARKIGELTGISREPVLHALEILRSEGLTTSRPGWPTRVAEQRQPRVMGPARYRDLLDRLRRGEPLPLQSAFTAENGAKWSQYSESPREFAEEAASALDRELLRLGDDVVNIWRRRFVRRINDKPFEIVRSAIPLHIAAGTILMDDQADPTPGGTIEVLFRNGYDPHLARHEVTSRAPNARERELLELQSADWVYDLLEIFTTADGTPIQAARTILPTSGTTLEFETDLSAA